VHLALTVAVLVAVVTAVAAAARRLDLPAPLVLVALGAAASFVPFIPDIALTAELALVGFLPPLLYSAALQTSLVDFNANRRSILLLSIGLVAFTTVGVGVVVHLVVPGVDWPAAFALGAVVAPPDAVAATAIARRIGMPRRVVTILEGESLLNDATALVALRTSIGAAAGVVSVLHIGWDFLVAAGGGVAVGLLAYVVVAWVRKHVTDPVLDTSVSLVTPFAAYVAAESFHASGVLAVVVAGLTLGHRAPTLQTPSSRIAERLNWRTISFLLEHLVFLLIGLQARDILNAVVQGDVPLATVLWACVATLLAVIVTRLAWVFPARFLLVRPDAEPQTGQRPSWGYTTVIGWAGMRGVVTLAAAFVIPADFPQRDLLVLIALAVTAGTLFLQGSSLPWLVRRLRLSGPDPREDALARAALLQEAGAAGRAWLDEHTGDDDPTGAVAAVRDRVERRDFAAWERLGDLNPDTETPSEAYARLRRDMLDVERNRVLEIRSTGRVPHEVVAEVLGTLDLEESMLDLRSERDARARAASAETVVTGAVGATVDACEHLREAPADPQPEPAFECEDCVAEGLTVWVHLRRCLTCGHVGCCDSSPRRHATAHFHETGHPVIRSAEPGEHWRWCYVDDRLG
jgi:CPA1 family monovalent cation:H+ antiporter